jgi:hypothetical protein
MIPYSRTDVRTTVRAVRVLPFLLDRSIRAQAGIVRHYCSHLWVSHNAYTRRCLYAELSV